MAKKKMGGLGKGLDRCGKSSLTPNSPASGLTTTR